MYEWYCTNIELERRKSENVDERQASQLHETPKAAIQEEVILTICYTLQRVVLRKIGNRLIHISLFFQNLYDDNTIILKKAVEILRHDIAAPDDLSLIEIEP